MWLRREGTLFIPDVLGLNYNLKAYDDLHASYPSIPLINTECTNADKSNIGNLASQLWLPVTKISGISISLMPDHLLPGACIWGFHDYGTEYKPVWPVQTSGVVDDLSADTKNPAITSNRDGILIHPSHRRHLGGKRQF